MTSSPDRHMQGIERRRGSESSTRGGPSSMSSEFRASDVKSAASIDQEPCKHICPTCSKRFYQPSTFRAHLIITHTSTTSFRCQFADCRREFDDNIHLYRHYRSHISPELSPTQSVEPEQLEWHRQTHDPDHVFVTGGTSGQPQLLPFNDLDSRPHQDSMRHLSRTLESQFSDDSEDGQDHQSPTDYRRCNDDYHHTRHLPVSAPQTPSDEDTHVALQSRKSHLHSPTHISMVSSPSQSDTDSRLDINITTSPHKRRRMSINFASEPSSSPPSSSSDNSFNMSSVTSNPVLSSVDHPFSNHSSFYSLHRNSSESSSIGSLVHESHYNASSPNPGNSTTSNAPFDIGLNNHLSSSQLHMADIEQGTNGANQTYPFVALPGNVVKERPLLFDEIERLYRCSWPNCTKAYATLIHLNTHIAMQTHGPKRTPSEFKELRKQWRKAKKEAELSHPVGVPARRGDNTRFNGPNMYNPTYKGSSSSPNAQSNNGSNSNGMDKTFPDWPSTMTTNGKWSRSGSPKSGSSSVSDLSQSPLLYPSSSYHRYSSLPSAQYNTSYNGSNSKGMTDTFSNWSNYPSPVAPNENHSRPGSAQSGSSGGRSDSP